MHLPRLIVVGGLLGGTLAMARVPIHRVEVHRVQNHLDSVLTELGADDVRGLSSGQRARRAALIQELRAYRDRGVFPHNYDFPGELVPYFVDRKTGTLCAVGDLLAFTGRRDIVDRVVRANNNVRVAELSDDSAFTTWLGANGLTLAEAARIQVVYAASGPSMSSIALMLGTPVIAGTAAASVLWNSAWNADGHSRTGSILGLVSGIASVGAGTAVAMNNGFGSAGPKFGAMSAAVGGLSILSSAMAMHSHARVLATARDADQRHVIAEPTISPIVSTISGRASAGALLSLKF